MATPDGVPQPRIPVTVSIGVAHFPVDVPTHTDAPADRLLEAADARMYDAKREGRNRIAYARARPVSVTTTRDHV
jgi:GGDEF domain-containing protein